MAVDLFTDTSSNRGISPRISFSHDLINCDITPIEPHIPFKSSLSDYDFDFCVSKRSCDQNSSLADELFSNGVILPVQLKKKHIPTISKSKSSSSSSSSSSRLLPPLPYSSAQTKFEANSSRETEEKQRSYSSNNNNNNNNDNKNNDDNKSFWKLKRSKSFNCGRIYRRGLCSLPLLSRSKSAGSTTNAKKTLIPKDDSYINQHYYLHQHHNQKSCSLKNSSSTHHQKPPLKKNYRGSSSFNSGLIQVNPVINVTTGNLFGFCSIFSNGKDKGKKK